MFDAHGNYSPPDVATRHVLVVTKAFTGTLQAGFSVPIAAGTVLRVVNLGQTQVAAGMGPQFHQQAANVALIEHATAKEGDILPMSDVTAGVAVAEKKQAAVHAAIAARKAAAPAEVKPAV